MPQMQLPPWEEDKTPSSRAAVLEVIADAIPQELKDSPRWVVWKAVIKEDGKITKPPFQARNPRFSASTSKPEHYSDFETALRACRDNDDVAGIGYVVMPGDGIVFIDLDDCMDEDGEPNADAQSAINDFATYAERSPSGNGVRIICRGVIPHDFCNKSLGREMYAGNGHRYMTITGQVLDALSTIEDSQPAIDHYFPLWDTHRNGAKVNGQIPSDMAKSVDLSRLSEFTLAVINGDYAPYGNDRSKALLGVCKDMLRAGYSFAEILRVTAHPDYPIAEAALERRRGDIDSAAEWVAKYSLTTAKAEIDAEPSISFSIGSHAVKTTNEKTESPASVAITPNEPGLPPGMAGQIAREITANAIRPQPQFAASAALLALSVASQNYYRCAYMGGSVNLYVCQVGGTASGKDGPRKAIKGILLDAGCGSLMPESIASGPALLRSLAKQASICYSPDEFGLMLQIALQDRGSVHQKDLVSELMRLYSLGNSFHGGKRYAVDGDSIEAIKNPFVCLLGSTTPDELTAALTQSHVDNGFLNRIIYVETDQHKPPKNRSRMPGFSQAIIDHLKGLTAHAQGVPASLKQPRMIAFKAEAAAHLDRFDEQCDDRIEGQFGALWARAHENATRVAGCVALGMPEPVVDLTIAQWSTEFVAHSVRSLINRLDADLSHTPFEADAKRVMKILNNVQAYSGDKNYGALCAEGLAAKQLITRLMHMPVRQLDQIIDYLVDCSLIEKGTVKPDGKQRDITVFRVINDVTRVVT